MLTTNRVQRASVALQMAEFATNVGRRLRRLREERKEEDPRWTQDFTARQIRADLTGAQYARWERGEVLPREETLEKIAEVFGVPLETFYSGPSTNGTTPDVLGELSDPLAPIRESLERLEAQIQELQDRLAEVASIGASRDESQARQQDKPQQTERRARETDS